MSAEPPPLTLITTPSVHSSVQNIEAIKADMQQDLDKYKQQADVANAMAEDYRRKIQSILESDRQAKFNKALTASAVFCFGTLTAIAAWSLRPAFDHPAYQGLLGTKDEQFVAVMESATRPNTDESVRTLRLQLRGYKLASMQEPNQ
jgi:predicted amidohydrolase YtcJ